MRVFRLQHSLPFSLWLLALCALLAAGMGLAGQAPAAVSPGVWSGLLWGMVAVTLALLFCGLRLVYGYVLGPMRQARMQWLDAREAGKGDGDEVGSELAGSELQALLARLYSHQAAWAQRLQDVHQRLHSLGVHSQNMAAGHSELTAQADGQAAALQQAAEGMEALACSVAHHDRQVQDAGQQTGSAAQLVQRGGQAVVGVAATLHALAAGSQKMTDIVRAIDSIAFQTSILALNASVEAARAGEQGRGFSVVASEVRTLAQRSAHAAREIKHLIEDCAGKIARGTAQAQDADAVMADIDASMAHLTGVMSEIAHASAAQSRHITQTREALVLSERITQQNVQRLAQAASLTTTMQDDVMQAQALAAVDMMQTVKPQSAKPLLPNVQPVKTLRASTRAPAKAPSHVSVRATPGHAPVVSSIVIRKANAAPQPRCAVKSVPQSALPSHAKRASPASKRSVAAPPPATLPETFAVCPSTPEPAAKPELKRPVLTGSLAAVGAGRENDWEEF